ncbi:hypothetical protein [Oceanobacillus sp. CAU 1775]
MGLLLYVVAAAMAVLGVLFFYKTNVEKLKENPEDAPKIQQKFFIGVAASEAIPIVFLILALVTIEPIYTMNDIILPAVFIGLIMVFSIFFIFMQRSVGVPEESKEAVTQFSFIAIAMSLAVPILSIVFLFLTLA